MQVETLCILIWITPFQFCLNKFREYALTFPQERDTTYAAQHFLFKKCWVTESKASQKWLFETAYSFLRILMTWFHAANASSGLNGIPAAHCHTNFWIFGNNMHECWDSKWKEGNCFVYLVFQVPLPHITIKCVKWKPLLWHYVQDDQKVVQPIFKYLLMVAIQ